MGEQFGGYLNCYTWEYEAWQKISVMPFFFYWDIV